jgi:transcriptional regulator with XRE-family HTH domain
MAATSKAVRIELAEGERDDLDRIVAAHSSERRMVDRARVVLLSADGVTVSEICSRTGLGPSAVKKWRARFADGGIDALRDAPRSGKPRVYDASARVAVTALACTKPEDGSTNWSVRKLARMSGMSPATVQRILAADVLKPHKVEQWCGKSPDPDFDAKQADIIGLYLDPPAGALVLSVDEKSQIQALDRTQPELPMRSGNPRRQTATYKRNGTTCLLAALEVHRGGIQARCVDSNNSDNFLKFLKHLYRTYPHVELHVILDNLSVHKSEEVKKWVAKRKRLTLHFTPTYSSWLNQIEIWFNILTRDVVRGGVWQSKQQLVNQLMTYVKSYNETQAKPFNWTYAGKAA